MTKVAEQNGERVLSSTAMPAVVAGQRITFDEAAQLDPDVYRRRNCQRPVAACERQHVTAWGGRARGRDGAQGMGSWG